MHTNWYLLVSRKVSLLAWWIVRGMIVFDFLITYSMDLETALTFTHGHFS